MKIYVGNLPFGTNEAELRSLFEGCGKVDTATIVTDRETGRSRGFGFVEMSEDGEARRAIETLNGYLLSERSLVVNEARPREDRGPRRDGGGRSFSSYRDSERGGGNDRGGDRGDRGRGGRGRGGDDRRGEGRRERW